MRKIGRLAALTLAVALSVRLVHAVSLTSGGSDKWKAENGSNIVNKTSGATVGVDGALTVYQGAPTGRVTPVGPIVANFRMDSAQQVLLGLQNFATSNPGACYVTDVYSGSTGTITTGMCSQINYGHQTGPFWYLSLNPSSTSTIAGNMITPIIATSTGGVIVGGGVNVITPGVSAVGLAALQVVPPSGVTQKAIIISTGPGPSSGNAPPNFVVDEVGQVGIGTLAPGATLNPTRAGAVSFLMNDTANSGAFALGVNGAASPSTGTRMEYNGNVGIYSQPTASAVGSFSGGTISLGMNANSVLTAGTTSQTATGNFGINDNRLMTFDGGDIRSGISAYYYASAGGGSLSNTMNGIAFLAARGTKAAPTAVQSGDTLAVYGGSGYDGSGWRGFRGRITLNAAENWTTSANGTNWRFQTTSAGGTSATNRVRIGSDGSVDIYSNGAFPSVAAAMLDVNGNGNSSYVAATFGTDLMKSSFTQNGSLEISTAGKVGIGLGIGAHPAYELDMIGTLNIKGVAGPPVRRGVVRLNDSGSGVDTDYWIGAGAGVGNGTGQTLAQYAPIGGGLEWGLGNIAKMVMDQAGNVGVGTTVPGAILDVATNTTNGPQFRVSGAPDVASAADGAIIQSNSAGNSSYGNLRLAATSGKSLYINCADASSPSGNYWSTPDFCTAATTGGTPFVISTDQGTEGIGIDKSVSSGGTGNVTIFHGNADGSEVVVDGSGGPGLLNVKNGGSYKINGLTAFSDVPQFQVGAFSPGLAAGTDFGAFVPNSAITLNRITVTTVIAGAGGATGTTYKCTDGTHEVSVTVAAGAAAGTITTATGTGAVAATTQVDIKITATDEVTIPQANVVCQYQMQ